MRIPQKTLLLIIFLAILKTSIFTQPMPPIEPGVAQTLAKWRAGNYSDVRYKLNITLEKGAPLMKGDIEIRVNISDVGAKTDLILDWRTTQFAGDKDKPLAKVVGVNDAEATGAWGVSPLANAAESGIEPSKDKQSDKQPASSRSALNASGTLALQSNEHLIIPKGLLKKGENVIKIQFASPIKTSGAAVTRYVDKEDGAEYVYSLFVPSDASTAFPVFDQPDLKAKFSLSIKTPADWKVVSNTKPKEIQNLTITHSQDWKKGLETTEFEETKPISTYVFAFAAGDFEVLEDKESSIPSKLYVRTSQLSKLKNANAGSADDSSASSAKARETSSQSSRVKVTETTSLRTARGRVVRAPGEEVFRLNREAVKYLESYFDYKFPFPKYDLVLIPEFPFGGMEHAGATFLREDRVIFPTEPTKNDFVTRANLIFHEAAHQWFGDTVTMRWFDDLWLKEGFAEFMAYKTLEKVMPEMNAWKIFYERNKQAAYLTDSTRGTTPIYQEIPNLSAAKSAYGNIVYRKAPSFLKQAEFYLGEDKFQTAVRAFLKKYQFKNAEWKDLVNEFEKAGGYDSGGLKGWAERWVTKPGLPIIRFGKNKDGSLNRNLIHGKYFYSYLQINVPDPKDIWGMKTKILVIHDNGDRDNVDSSLAKQKSYDELEAFPGTVIIPPNWNVEFIFVNYQDYGYGIFLLDEKSRAYVLENIQNEKDDFLRTMMWGSLWDSVREAELAPRDYVELVIKNLGVESDESTIQTLLGRVSTAMSYYLSEPPASVGGLNTDNRNAKISPPANAGGSDLSARLENLLIEKMRNAPTLGQRITFYRAFLNIASSEKARATLKDILNGKFVIKDFQLKTKDRFDILTRLLILGEEASPLLQELAKTERSDDARRYAYGAQAAIATAQNKKEFYNDFVNNPAIPESWIEAAFAPFNSVRHADLTLPYLEKALSELPNLKRSRKIFFVNGWLGAFIGGQKSEEALQIVNKFLADNPNLDRDLRLKILENADGLERAVKIRTKFSRE